ncbi:hypothetical protein GALMADRAFT_227148 [Galerina marginata CBS 339.88]|uniref:Uncharacterized protein n=1 Tax=Galerina marginata (strain CBS 339.88) TaxID=685588 RepID=A0A067T466_GALM3|nr:hypothetical protein GALMADRAFT_227148 [Galerina marginata CBS 339.88]
MTPKRVLNNFDLPTRKELQACWELCRLQNNIGFWVIWLPTVWSIAMAYHAEPEINALQAISCACKYILLCFGIKSLIMTIDDILDSDIDGLVERTKMRPIPQGAISLGRAWVFFYCQVVFGLCLAVKFLNTRTLLISAIVWPIYIIYPTCKRWTNMAPLPLGIMFNVGVFMGWADLGRDNVTMPWNTLLPVYIGTCLWTITYETIYQHQDRVDDIKIGLYSPALLLGDYTTSVCTITAAGFFGLLSHGGLLNRQGGFYFGGLTIAGMLLFARLWRTNVYRPEECRQFFLQTVWIGQIILGGVVLDVVFHRLRNGIPL